MQLELDFAGAEESYERRAAKLAAALSRVRASIYLDRLCERVWQHNERTRQWCVRTYREIATDEWWLRCSEGQAKRVVRQAEELGLLTIREGVDADGRTRANAYQIDWAGVETILERDTYHAAEGYPTETPGSRRDTPGEPCATRGYLRDTPGSRRDTPAPLPAAAPHSLPHARAPAPSSVRPSVDPSVDDVDGRTDTGDPARREDPAALWAAAEAMMRPAWMALFARLDHDGQWRADRQATADERDALARLAYVAAARGRSAEWLAGCAKTARRTARTDLLACLKGVVARKLGYEDARPLFAMTDPLDVPAHLLAARQACPTGDCRQRE